MKKRTFQRAAAAVLTAAMLVPQMTAALAAETPAYTFDVAAALEQYNVTRTTLGQDSGDSMPMGNGDITANVWVEQNGDLCFYIGKSDTWSESTRLLKLGKIRVQLTDSQGQPLTAGTGFYQTLDLYDGEMTLNIGGVDLRLWIDANHPVIRVEASGAQEFQMKVSTEIWRDQEIGFTSENAHSYRGVADQNTTQPGPGTDLTESADQTLAKDDCVIWYHRNTHSNYEVIKEKQNVDGVVTAADPYLNRTFGACLKGDSFTVQDDHKTLASETPGTEFSFAVYPYTAQTETLEQWEQELTAMVSATEAVPTEDAKTAHQTWWNNFWNRSYIFVTGDDDATVVTRGYLMQRYMQAIQGRGNYPIKFNGGTINFDYMTDYPQNAAVNGDYRKWGPCYWFQNTRLQYWNMLSSGDFEMMLPLFEMYYDMLETQKEVTKAYYGHDGAFFPETLYFHGLYSVEDFGWNNDGVETESQYIRYYWQGGLELSAMMLEYYNYTLDEETLTTRILPIAREVITFFDQHYPRESDGTLSITPSHALETYWDGVTNPTDVVAGLHCVLPLLLALPEQYTTEADRAQWQALYAILPEIPLGSDGAETFVKPAETYDATTHNSENPELYSVFPYKLYGVGKDDLETAVNTYDRRIFTDNLCWRQNGIQAAYLGLADDARADILDHFRNVDSADSFPGYWGKGFDWTPDLDNGGSAMTALQAMVLQSDTADKAYVFPAWPSDWNVDFKLHAPNDTVVTGSYQSGQLVHLDSTTDMELVLPGNQVRIENPYGLTITASAASVSAGEELILTAEAADYVESYCLYVNGLEVQPVDGQYRYTPQSLMGTLTVTAKVQYTFDGTVPMEGLMVRLSADQAVTSDDNNKVSAWGPVSQSDPAKQPTYVETAYGSGSAIRFDGSSQYLIGTDVAELNGKNAMTVVLVSNGVTPLAYEDGNGATAGVFGFGDLGWGGAYICRDTDAIKYRFGTGGENCHNVCQVPAQTDTLTTIQAVKSGAEEFLYVDGTLVQEVSGKLETTANIGTTMLVGASTEGTNRLFQGDICEILIYDRVLTETEQMQLQTYIQQKYFTEPQTTHTVTFDTEGGSVVAPQQVEDGQNAEKPADPTRDGYTFLGWFSDADRTEPYDFTEPVTEDLTLYAKWEQQTVEPICSADAAIRVLPERDGEYAVFEIDLVDARNIDAVQVTFTAPAGAIVTAQAGFTYLDPTVRTMADGTQQYTAVFCYLEEENYTQAGSAAIASIKVPGQNPTVTMEEVLIAAYDDANDQPAFGDPVEILNGTATFRGCDLDGSGEVDLLDVLAAMKFFGSKSGDADWDQAKMADLDDNGEVSIDDLITIVLHFTK